MLEHLAARGANNQALQLVYGARDDADLVKAERIGALAARIPKFTYHTTSSGPGSQHPLTRHVTDHFSAGALNTDDVSVRAAGEGRERAPACREARLIDRKRPFRKVRSRERSLSSVMSGLRDQCMLGDCGHIIVADDDASLRQMVIRFLGDHNVPTKAASNRTELCRHLAGSLPSVIILDLQLGQDDGLDILREIRAHSDVPVIITTGHRPDEIDRVVGLELGADACIEKPFSFRELLARVRAVLRRQEMGRVAHTHDAQRGGYRFDGWQLERRGRRLVDPNATPIALSKGEYALLLAFLEAPQRPLSREHLLHAIHRIHEDIFDRSIDVQVLRLRRKLEIDPSAPRVIRTERSVGYIFALPVDPF
jgi:DNA-binding response OmpR family regulator